MHFCLISFEKCGERGYFIHGEVQDEVVNVNSLQTSADGRRLPRPGRAGSELADTHRH